MKEFLLHTVDEKFMSKENMDLVVFLDDPDEIINYIKNYKKATRQQPFYYNPIYIIPGFGLLKSDLGILSLCEKF